MTAMNENYQQPSMPKGVEKDIIKGMYCLSQSASKKSKLKVRLLGSGTILREVIAAQALLQDEFSVAANVWSVTSFNELRRDCESVARYNRLHPKSKQKKSHVLDCLGDDQSPVIAATDYMKMYADQIRQDISAPYSVLGTDGFGRSDTRAALRDFFEVDAKMIAYTALKALVDQGDFSVDDLAKAKADLEATETDLSNLKDELETLRGSLQQENVSSVETFSKMNVVGLVPIASFESWDGEQYATTIISIWTVKEEERTRALYSGQEVVYEPGASSVKDFINSTDWSTAQGVRKFFDDKGNFWLLSIGSSQTQGLFF